MGTRLYNNSPHGSGNKPLRSRSSRHEVFLLSFFSSLSLCSSHYPHIRDYSFLLSSLLPPSFFIPRWEALLRSPLLSFSPSSSSSPSSRWEEYLGYMGIILSSAMSVNRHWENEDIVWVYKDFTIDVVRD